MIVIPCNTAHLWFDAIQAEIAIPMLHIVDTALHKATADANCPLPTIDATAALAQGAVDWSRHMRSR